MLNTAFFRQENRVLWLNPSTPVFLSFAWLFSALLAFYAGGFYMGNEASAHTLLSFLPWVFALMLPALAMNTWAEDWRRGTAERFLTLPLGLGTLLTSRFLALWGLTGLFLLGTWPFVATLFWLGSPDIGPLVSGYLGAFLLGGTLMAASLFASALSRSYVVAFVGGMLLCLLLIVSGWGIALAWVSKYLPPEMVSTIRDISLMEHYRTFIVGQINLRSMLFFASLIGGFNFLTWVVLRKRTARVGQISPWILGTAGCAVVAGLVMLAPVMPGRLDLSAEKLFTLSPQTKAILQQAGKMKLTVYFSESNPELPTAARRLQRQLLDMLADFQHFAPETFSYTVENTDASVVAEVEAAKVGMAPKTLPSGEVYYHGLYLESEGRNVIAPMLEADRAPYLEFDLASLMAESQKTRRKNLTVLAIPELVARVNRPDFLRELGAFYNITFIQPGQPQVPAESDALVVMPAAYYPQESLYAVSQYLMRGGRVMMFVDPYYRSAPESVPNLPDRNADAFALDHMADLLRAYGVAYDGEAIVGDAMLASPVSEETVGYTTYPFWLSLTRSNVNTHLPFTSFITDILLAEPGSFRHLEPVAGLKVEDIFFTTPQAQQAARAMFDSMSPQMIGPQLKTPHQQEILGVVFTGKFPSLFKQMPDNVTRYYQDYSTSETTVAGPAMLMEASKDGALIALADVDFTSPKFAFRNVPGPDGKAVPQSANDNLVFLFNSLQWLTGEGELLGLRGKGVNPRTFKRVEQLLQSKAIASQKVEQQMAAELYEVSKRMAALKARNVDANEIDALAEEEQRTYFAREYKLKANLRQVRRALREEITQLGHVLGLINALLMPSLLLGGYAVYRMRRRRRG